MVTYHIFAPMDTEIAYVDSFEDAFHDSKVQRALEKMFSLESLETSDYNHCKINQFKDSISYKDKLPWHKWIPSNPAVVLRALDRVA